MFSDKDRHSESRNEGEQDCRDADVDEIGANRLPELTDRPLHAEDCRDIARGAFHRNQRRDVRMLAVGRFVAVNRLIESFLFIKHPVFPRVFFIGCISPEAKLPRCVFRIVHRVVDHIEYIDKSSVIFRVDLYDIDERDIHPMAVFVHGNQGFRILHFLFSFEIGVYMVAVDLGCRCIGHMPGRCGVFLLNRSRKRNITERADNDAEYDQREND